jgi:hypothetical protein
MLLAPSPTTRGGSRRAAATSRRRHEQPKVRAVDVALDQDLAVATDAISKAATTASRVRSPTETPLP